MSQVEGSQEIMSEDMEMAGEKLVPVSEAIRYRRRAQSAEKRVAVLEDELANSKFCGEQLTEKINQLEIERELISKLGSAGVCDLETGLLLAKARVPKGQDSDPETIVQQLRREKQYLFKDSPGIVIHRAAGAKQKGPECAGVLERAGRKAATSGSRADLQEYLKLRRNFI
ncbi:MAG: hypothetical protein ABIG61_08105 [Planctomycetota bacterium]